MGLSEAWLGKNEINPHDRIPVVQSLRDMPGDVVTSFPVFFLLQAVFTSNTLETEMLEGELNLLL